MNKKAFRKRKGFFVSLRNRLKTQDFAYERHEKHEKIKSNQFFFFRLFRVFRGQKFLFRTDIKI